MSFSGAIKLADLSDYIGPSQSCVKPMMEASKAEKPASTVKIEYTDVNTSKFSQIRSDPESETAKITLNDCLACNGCITSAETILIQQQSIEVLLTEAPKRKLRVASISPQFRVSLAEYFDLDVFSTWKKLCSFLKQYLNVDFVFDTSYALDIALIEASNEFIAHFEENKFPLISSECPGWVCYAEKTQHEMIPFMSNVKSPQQIMGVIGKKYISDVLSISCQDIYHFAVMPCFDKKLEATRFEEEIDLVIASFEMLDLIRSMLMQKDEVTAGSIRNEFLKLSEEQYRADDRFPFDNLTKSSSLQEPSRVLSASLHEAGSGGYVDYIFRYAARTLFKVDLDPNLPLSFSANKKNPDFQEVELIIDGEVKLRFAKAYGFRNIQNLVRKLKKAGLEFRYHYVEVMACPSGCLNGGGQIPAKGTKTSDGRKSIKAQKELISRLDRKFHETMQFRDPRNNLSVSTLYNDWFDRSENNVLRQLLYTSFTAVPPLEQSLDGSNSAEAVALGIHW